MVEYAESVIIQNKFALGVFLDIQGVSDNESIDAVIKGMQDKAICYTKNIRPFFISHSIVRSHHFTSS